MDNQQPIPDRECKHCGEIFTPTRYNNVYCSQECNRLFKRKGTTKKFKPKPCNNCGVEYTPEGSCSKYCGKCMYHKALERHKITNLKYRAKHQKVGVGSGGNQGKGKEHHSYKNGIGCYKNNLKPQCERCNQPAVLVHHKDYNRYNNEADNLESLCKRCHQLEHKCWESFSKGRGSTTISKESRE